MDLRDYREGYGILWKLPEDEIMSRLRSAVMPIKMEKWSLLCGDYFLADTQHPQDSDLYIEWLADYLHQFQREQLIFFQQEYFKLLKKRCDNNPTRMGSCLGDDAYFHFDIIESGPIYQYPKDFNINKEIQIEALKSHKGMDEFVFENLDRSGREGYDSKYEYVQFDYNYYLISLIELNQLIEICHQKPKAIETIISKADMPWRPILAAILKDIPKKRERISVLNEFFTSFSRCLAK